METKDERELVLHETFKTFDIDRKDFLTPLELQALYSDIRLGSLSLPQIDASLEYATVTGVCEQEDLYHVLKEMDRRYFLVQDFRWEFSLLDTAKQDTITEDQAKWFVQTVHGEFFSNLKWERFIRNRNVPRSGVSFAEIEVMLCNIPRKEDIDEEEEEARRDAEEALKRKQEMEKRLLEEREKRKRQREEDRRRKEEEERKLREDAERRRQEEEAERRLRQQELEDAERRRRNLEDEEERGRREAEEREQRAKEHAEAERRAALRDLEAQRLKDEREANNDERDYMEAARLEKEAQDEAADHVKRGLNSKDDLTKRDAKAAEERARMRGKEMRNKKIRFNLKVAVKRRDRERLPPAVQDFKDAKLPDDDGDLAKAEQILKEWLAGDGLLEAMSKRQLKELEQAIAYIKRNGFEGLFEMELIEAQKILLQLRRLERIRAEILELRQSTVAEIRSYQKPPHAVHTVMIGTFLTLGHPEKETRQWKNVQILVGKTGKEGLKRRCLELEPITINPANAMRCKELLAEVDLDDIRDVSAAAATFFVWSISMIDEMESQLKARDFEQEQKRKKLEEKKKAEERRRRIAQEAGEEVPSPRPESAASEAEGGAAGGPETSGLLASKAGHAKVTMGDIEKQTDFNLKIKTMNKVPSRKITEQVTGMKVIKEAVPKYDDRKGVKHYDLELDTEDSTTVRKIVKTIRKDDK